MADQDVLPTNGLCYWRRVICLSPRTDFRNFFGGTVICCGNLCRKPVASLWDSCFLWVICWNGFTRPVLFSFPFHGYNLCLRLVLYWWEKLSGNWGKVGNNCFLWCFAHGADPTEIPGRAMESRWNNPSHIDRFGYCWVFGYLLLLREEKDGPRCWFRYRWDCGWHPLAIVGTHLWNALCQSCILRLFCRNGFKTDPSKMADVCGIWRSMRPDFLFDSTLFRRTWRKTRNDRFCIGAGGSIRVPSPDPRLEISLIAHIPTQSGSLLPC